MTLIIGFLTAILFLNSLLLVLLVLIQLPKKDAGAGLAFGGAATDALFGAGSGNALTQITKYSAGLFLGLAVILTILNNKVSHADKFGVEEALEQRTGATPAAPAQSSTVETSTSEPVTQVPVNATTETTATIPVDGGTVESPTPIEGTEAPTTTPEPN